MRACCSALAPGDDENSVMEFNSRRTNKCAEIWPLGIFRVPRRGLNSYFLRYTLSFRLFFDQLKV